MTNGEALDLYAVLTQINVLGPFDKTFSLAVHTNRLRLEPVQKAFEQSLTGPWKENYDAFEAAKEELRERHCIRDDVTGAPQLVGGNPAFRDEAALQAEYREVAARHPGQREASRERDGAIKELRAIEVDVQLHKAPWAAFPANLPPSWMGSLLLMCKDAPEV